MLRKPFVWQRNIKVRGEERFDGMIDLILFRRSVNSQKQDPRAKRSLSF